MLKRRRAELNGLSAMKFISLTSALGITAPAKRTEGEEGERDEIEGEEEQVVHLQLLNRDSVAQALLRNGAKPGQKMRATHLIYTGEDSSRVELDLEFEQIQEDDYMGTDPSVDI